MLSVFVVLIASYCYYCCCKKKSKSTAEKKAEPSGRKQGAEWGKFKINAPKTDEIEKTDLDDDDENPLAKKKPGNKKKKKPGVGSGEDGTQGASNVMAANCLPDGQPKTPKGPLAAGRSLSDLQMTLLTPGEKRVRCSVYQFDIKGASSDKKPTSTPLKADPKMEPKVDVKPKTAMFKATTPDKKQRKGKEESGDGATTTQQTMMKTVQPMGPMTKMLPPSGPSPSTPGPAPGLTPKKVPSASADLSVAPTVPVSAAAPVATVPHKKTPTNDVSKNMQTAAHQI